MSVVDELTELRDRIESVRALQARLRGQLEQIESTLKREYGLTFEEAEGKVEELERRAEKLEKQLGRYMRELKELLNEQ